MTSTKDRTGENTLDSSATHEPAAQPLYQAAFEDLPKPALIVNRQCTIVALNKVARRKLGQLIGAESRPPCEPDAIRATPPSKLSDYFLGSDEQFRKQMIVAVSGGKLTLNPRQAPANRQHFLISPLRHGARKLEQFLLIHDEVKHVSKVFGHLKQQLLESNHLSAANRREKERLQRSFELLEQFNSVAVHDIKAPLRNISSLLGFIQEDFADKLPDQGRHHLSRARRAADRLSMLVTSLLHHAKSGSATIEKTSLDLGGLIEDISDSLDPSLKTAGARISIETPLAAVNGDVVLVRQLLENLINNAIKYRSTARTLEIVISGSANGLTIQDNGIGFDNQYNEQIFEPFKRLHAAEDIEGSGLGLATCRQICLRHNWTLSAQGLPDKGARFTIQFD
ncbi:MAG: sensor histidine kinase [Burkholderiaceae bacterium]